MGVYDSWYFTVHPMKYIQSDVMWCNSCVWGHGITQRLKINLKINFKGKRDLHKWCPLCYCYERRCLICWENDKDRQLSDRKETLVGREVTFETPLRVVVCYCDAVCYETRPTILLWNVDIKALTSLYRWELNELVDNFLDPVTLTSL